MIIKVGNDILDFDDVIEVEKQIKLIEEISTSDGDFSYSFEIEKTLNNTRALGNPQPDNVNKKTYQRISSQILNDSGAIIYNGYLRIERVTDVYECSFFAGNNNWFGLLTGLLSDLNLSQFDKNLSESEIVNSTSATEGVVFPLSDYGTLLTRSDRQLKVEDFVPGMYIKTIFYKIFYELGIKLEGELFNDWVFNNTVCVAGQNNNEVKKRTTYAGKFNDEYHFVDGDLPMPELKLNFETDSQFPFFDGSSDNFDISTSRYTADVKMSVKVDLSLDHTNAYLDLWIYKNGVKHRIVAHRDPGDQLWVNTQGSTRVNLEAGDYIEFYANPFVPDPLNLLLHLTTATVRITPVFLYKAWGSSIVPNWTKQQFVSNVLRMFNALPSYNATSGTLTINLFEKIGEKESIDLSEYVSSTDIDYTEFISNYGKKSKLSYNEVEFSELENFDPRKYFKYAQGYINVNNDFLEDENDIIESDFSSSVAYEHPVFNASLERMNILDLDQGETHAFENVLDNGAGVARFYLVDDDVPIGNLSVGDMVRIADDNKIIYNGDWIIAALGTVDDYVDWIELKGVAYSSDIPGNIIKLDFIYSGNDDVFLLINVPNEPVSDFSPWSSYYLESSTISTLAFGYFDLINTSEPINDKFIYSLSFGGNTDPRHYQVTMTDRYFSLLKRVLNDPVKPFCEMYLPTQVYEQIDFLSPAIIRTMETTNRYFINRITGYQESFIPCTIELVKLP